MMFEQELLEEYKNKVTSDEISAISQLNDYIFHIRQLDNQMEDLNQKKTELKFKISRITNQFDIKDIRKRMR